MDNTKIINHLQNLMLKTEDPHKIKKLLKLFPLIADAEHVFKEKRITYLLKEDKQLVREEPIEDITPEPETVPVKELIEEPVSHLDSQKEIQDLVESTPAETTNKPSLTECLSACKAKSKRTRTDLGIAITNALTSRADGKKVSSQLKVSTLADKIGCTTSYLIKYIRENFADKYELMNGIKIPPEAIHVTGSVQSKPFYVVPKELL